MFNRNFFGQVMKQNIIGPPAVGRQNILFALTFEGANLNSSLTGWTQVQDCCALDSGSACCLRPIKSQTTEQSRSGTHSMKIDMRSTDPVVSSSVRCEVEPGSESESDTMERWYGGSWYLKDWLADGFGDSILQWHDNNGTCPPLSIQTYDPGGGTQHLFLKQCITTSGAGSNENEANDLGAVTSNTWMDIVIHVKWSPTTAGQLQCWVNGVQKVNKSGIRTNPASGGSYLKLGMNKFNWADSGGALSPSLVTSRTFYIDEFRISSTVGAGGYNDVAP